MVLIPTSSTNALTLAGTTPTAAGLALLDDADNTAQRTTLGLGTIATLSATNPSLAGATFTGHALFSADNTYDIGASGATRPANIYAATQIMSSNTIYSENVVGFRTKGYIYGSSDGVWRMTDAAGTSFGRLQFGGTTSSYPALKRNSTSIDVVLGDDSAKATLAARTLIVHNDTATAGECSVANTYTSSTTNELYRTEWSSNVCYTGVKAGSVGGTARLEVNTGGAVKALTAETATGFVRIACANDVAIAGCIHYGIYATDSTEYQMRSGSVNFAIVNEGGGDTYCGLGTVLNEAIAVSSGTLTVTFDSDVSAGATVDIRATATSSLSETALGIRYRVEIFGPSAVCTPL